jgi:hypothetical protein
MQYARTAGCHDTSMNTADTIAAQKPSLPRARVSRNGRSRVAGANAAARTTKAPAMWRWMAIAALLWGGCMPAAQAQNDARDSSRILVQRASDRDNSRRSERRDDRREERRRADRDPRERLTPDEHRELNRDLQRANREFYRKGREKR